MFNRAIVIDVAMDIEVLHWHCIFGLAASCFAIKFIGRGPKHYKNWCWFFWYLRSWKVLNFYPEIWVGTLTVNYFHNYARIKILIFLVVCWFLLLGGKSWPAAQCGSVHLGSSQTADCVKSCTGTRKGKTVARVQLISMQSHLLKSLVLISWCATFTAIDIIHLLIYCCPY